MLRLGELRFSPQENTLYDRQNEAVHLRKQSVMVLRFLAENMGQVVEKKQIFDTVWGGLHVSDDSLTQCISEIRRALAPNGRDILRTVHGRGFRLIGETEAEAPAHGKLKPLIAVFPFSIIGDDETSKLVRDLIADDLTQSLSRSDSLAVISTLSARRFALSDTWNDDIRAAANVDYVLRGSLAVRSDNVILRMELIDAETLQVVWSDGADYRLDDLVHDTFSLITVTSNVHRAVLGAELNKARSLRLTDLQGHTIFTNALDHMHQSDPSKFQEARGLLQGLNTGPRSEPIVLAANSLWHLLEVLRTHGEDTLDRLRKGQHLAEQALSMDVNSITALSVSSTIRLMVDGDVPGARNLLERALIFNPNAYKERLLLGVMEVHGGDTERGLENVETALRLAANHPYIAHLMNIAAPAFVSAGQLDRATEANRHSLSVYPSYGPAIRMEVITESVKGNHQRARQSAQRLLEIEPNATVNEWMRFSMVGKFPIGDVFSNAMLEAGIPP